MSSNSIGLAWSTKGLQSVCPTGVATFDQLIGGGFALTSVNVLDEDCDRMYATMLAKAYLASGLLASQRLMIFSCRITSIGSRFLKELPSMVEDPMKIAFRYRNLPSRFAAHQEGEDGSATKLDFGQCLDHSAVVESADISFFSHSDLLPVLHDLATKTYPETFSTTQTNSNQIIRVLVDELGSPLSPLEVDTLPRTLHRLKVLLRQLPQTVCLVTLTSDRSSPDSEQTSSSSFDLLSSISPTIRERIHSHADSVVRLISFPEEGDEQEDGLNENSSKNPYAADYVGFLHLLRLPRLNSFAPYNAASLETTEYGIKLRNSRRHLAIEKLALPPDLGETVSRFTSSSKTSSEPSSLKPPPSLSCASVLTNF